MALEIVRRTRDNLLGSVDITLLEDKIIAHPYFQRLRRVRQTAFLSMVFPGASHSRFEHSLGVMHLAQKSWEKLKANQARLVQAYQRNPQFSWHHRSSRSSAPRPGQIESTFPLLAEIFSSDYILQVLRLSALLHDVGHPPFSHSGERYLPSLGAILRENPDVPDYLRAFYYRRHQANLKKSRAGAEKPVRHEFYSILLVDRLLRDVHRDYPDITPRIEAQDVISVIMPAIDPAPESELLRLKVHKLCHELVSGEIDIDRMDYLQRDSRECGVVYGMFDRDRLLDSLAIYFDEDEVQLHLAIQFSGLAAFEDYLRARQSMYLQLYFHKTSVACEAMLQYMQRYLPQFILPAALDEYVQVDDGRMVDLLFAAVKASDHTAAVKAQLAEVIANLFYNRRLWKRVFESSSLVVGADRDEDLSKAKEVLEAQGIAYEQLASINYLTSASAVNYLKLIKKDEIQGMSIANIEDHSHLYRMDKGVRIKRLYVAGADAVRAKASLQEAMGGGNH